MNIKKLLFFAAVTIISGCDGQRELPIRSEVFFTKPEQKLASAVSSSDLEEIDKMLSKGVDINCRGEDGITPLIWAVVRQKKDSYKYLLERGADPNLQTVQGDSVISFAAITRDSDNLKLALEHCGDPNLIDSNTGKTPIYEAISNLRKNNIDLLIQYGANLNFQDRTGYTPLMDAASINQYDVVYKMISEGANIWVTNNFGNTIAFKIEQGPMDPDHELYKWRNKVVELLREQGMDVRPWTPEHGPGRERPPRTKRFLWEK